MRAARDSLIASCTYRPLTFAVAGLTFAEGRRMARRAPHIPNHTPFHALCTLGKLAEQELQAALRQAREEGRDIESILIESHHLPADLLRACLREHYGSPVLSSSDEPVIEPELLQTLSGDYLRTHHWLPLKRQGRTVQVLIDDPGDLEKAGDVQRAFPGMVVQYIVALRRDIARLLAIATGSARQTGVRQLLDDLRDEHQPQGPGTDGAAIVHESHNKIVRLANQIIRDAYQLGASDIHIEPNAQHDTVVRLRVDGTCFPYMAVPALCRRALISRLKIMANLDIAEKRKPQDGKIRFLLSQRDAVEVRVATLPTGGCDEDVVLRILTGRGPLPLVAMDLSPHMQRDLIRLAQKPYGIILCVGPTGSGKTTTLHALLHAINTQERKIWTAEDPIEITQSGLRQVQVHPKIGLTFAAALRAFLRADPDVIMIGEMRDRETADIALEASLTGHLVLSTLHTNSSVETVTRLLDLGCDPFNFADALLGILAKRLCKRLCLECKEHYRPSRDELDALAADDGADRGPRLPRREASACTLARARGCESCKGTGYKGRLALYELLIGSDEIRGLIQAKAPAATLLKHAMEAGLTTLVQDGVCKVLAGETTLAEVQRVAVK